MAEEHRSHMTEVARTEHSGPQAIHLPPPSLSPATIGLGIFLICFGLLYAVPLLVIGAVIFLVGVITWIVDDARAYVAAGEGGGHGGGH